MMGMIPTMISASLGSSPMPSQTMKSGMKASGGNGRMTSMTGSMRWRANRQPDMAAPTATPTITPMMKPIRILCRLMYRSNQSGLPWAG